MNTGHKKKRPARVRFLADDPAALWKEGQTADDLGPNFAGSSARLFRLDHYDDLVVLEDPYGRGLVERFGDDEEPMDPAED